MVQVLNYLIAGFALLFFLWLSLMLLLVVIVGTWSHSWPTVKGTITHSQLVRQKKSHTGSYLRSYYPALRYEYEVHGKKYASGNLSIPDIFHDAFNRGMRSKNVAGRILKKYPKGGRVTVHYWPNKPWRAVLEARVVNFTVIVFVIVVLVIIATAVHVASW